MTDLFYVDGSIKRKDKQIREEVLREAENMYNDINKIPNRRFLTEEQAKELLDIGDIVNGLIYHNTFKS